jgi:predicted NAD-dependent protein-ADP-ribosyltransferase YbiA (DUF1768 family)
VDALKPAGGRQGNPASTLKSNRDISIKDPNLRARYPEKSLFFYVNGAPHYVFSNTAPYAFKANINGSEVNFTCSEGLFHAMKVAWILKDPTASPQMKNEAWAFIQEIGIQPAGKRVRDWATDVLKKGKNPKYLSLKDQPKVNDRTGKSWFGNRTRESGLVDWSRVTPDMYSAKLPTEERYAIHAMDETLYAKALNNPQFRDALLGTEDFYLFENTLLGDYLDDLWGNGNGSGGSKFGAGGGENQLGKSLMRLRSRLRTEGYKIGDGKTCVYTIKIAS